ncbi:multidrug efflux system outer membrane protein [Dysgonomonas sp. PH5-45]|uniref:efflux transporter outer membrane subunit n=1 Tax=unclassified Dysgonomonas TaxID=2630389 RepID=UPI002475979C|nr:MULTISPECIES: TolC family protein [unclassified Dysgonomonas]MDH6354883.1 multidrug efflux system outer membrane protein [Dysgonomonas sp. PH5-45]MDH6387782.1 multidrug efflux system outer membrane protein [Dysgonomonas sp. PH5-37]
MSKTYIKGAVLLGLAVSIGLSSCQVVNKYKSPEVDTENLYRDHDSTDTTTIASIPWREYFKDPILQALIDEGIANNYDLKIAYTRIEQAEASLGMARAAYFPEVALSGSVTHNRYSKGSEGNKALKYHSTDYSLGIAASWELDVWGKLNRQSRAKYADFLSSVEYRNLIQTSLISNIATSYYTLLSLDEQLKVSLESINLLEETITTMEALKEAGMLNGASVEQTKAALYNTRISIPDLEMNIRKMENSLSLMLGRKAGPIVRGTIASQSIPTEMKIGMPMQMLANRPDVKQAELSFRSAFELTNAAQASFYPSIRLNTGSFIGYGTTNTLSGFFKPENLAASIIGGLTQPIFARKQLITQLKIAKSTQKAALLGFEQTVLSASNEVSDILYTYEKALSKDKLRQQQIESLTKSVRFTQELLKAGEANYLEVIQAETDLLQAQLGQVNDRLQQLQATVNLYRALGGGIE